MTDHLPSETYDKLQMLKAIIIVTQLSRQHRLPSTQYLVTNCLDDLLATITSENTHRLTRWNGEAAAENASVGDEDKSRQDKKWKWRKLVPIWKSVGKLNADE